MQTQIISVVAATVVAILLPDSGATAGPCGRAFCVLQTFTGESGTALGQYPQGGLVADSAGTLFGTTFGALATGGPAKYCPKSCGNTYAFSAGTETPLHSFNAQVEQQNSDGAFPTGELLLQTDNLGKVFYYGTTQYGPGAGCGGLGCGVAYRLAADNSSEQTYVFCREASCADGVLPRGGLVADDSGNFFGTTQFGGKGRGWLCGSNLGGCGTIYQLTWDGTTLNEQVLYSFCKLANCQDGAAPFANLLRDPTSGKLYGTTQFGGAHSRGTLFRLNPPFGTNDYTVLYSFCSQHHCSDGSVPQAGLIADAEGNLFGTTANGGDRCKDFPTGCGVVFELSAAGQYSVLHSFAVRRDGAVPEGQLVFDDAGNLYGTTSRGGVSCKHVLRGCGTVFKLTPSGTTWTTTVLHRFRAGTQGRDPQGALVWRSGTLYGVTHSGGGGGCSCGTIYSFDTSATGTVRRSSTSGDLTRH